MTTTTSIHSGSTPPAPPTIGTGVRGFQVLPREQTRPGAARTVTLASGIIMVVLALVLLAEQLLPVLMANTGAAG